MPRAKKTTTEKKPKRVKKVDETKVKKPKAPKTPKAPRKPKAEKVVKAAKTPKAPRKPKAEKVVKAAKEPKVNENWIPVAEPTDINFDQDYVGEKSGAYIKRLLEANSLTTEEIVEAVKKTYPKSKVKNSDVGFHRAKLKAEGIATQVVRISKDGQRYTLGV
jgi:hypothetical protein